VKGVHRGEPRFRSLYLSCGLYLVEISKPLGGFEVLIVKALLQALLMEYGFWDKLKVNKRAGQESPVWIFENLQRPLSFGTEDRAAASKTPLSRKLRTMQVSEPRRGAPTILARAHGG